MKRRFTIIAIVLLMATSISGCAVGNKYMIADVQAQFGATGQYAVAVVSLDQREFIVDKKSPATYVGMVRGGYGNPFNATTDSDLPFSDDVTQSICNSLNRKGFKAKPVSATFELTEEDVLARLLSNKADRAIFIAIRKWESDSFINLNVGYDLIMKVFDKDGATLAQAEAKDDVNIPGSIWIGSVSMSKTEVPNIFRKSIETLFNDPNVVKALNSD